MRARRFTKPRRGTAKTEPSSKLSPPGLHDAVIRIIAGANAERALTGECVDIGSGKGELLRRIRAEFPLKTSACDYSSELMRGPEQRVDVADLNEGRLSYESDRFSLVTCLETIEHLEHTRPLLREIFRVLEPAGLAVISTPNILNLRSRLRYLCVGFFNLFGPLEIGERHIHNPAGHINPVSYFYLAHALCETGFERVEPSIDAYQRRSWFAFIPLYLPMKITRGFFWRREQEKLGTITPRNRALVAAMNSRDLLLGRTLIVCARKPE